MLISNKNITMISSWHSYKISIFEFKQYNCYSIWNYVFDH